MKVRGFVCMEIPSKFDLTEETDINNYVHNERQKQSFECFPIQVKLCARDGSADDRARKIIIL